MESEVLRRQADAPLDTEITSLDLLDHRGVDWDRVQRTAFLIHQYLKYEYPGPIEDLRHRLMLVPPDYHFDQRRIVHRIEVSGAPGAVEEHRDAFGNVVLEVVAPYVEQTISFEVWIVVERRSDRVVAVERAIDGTLLEHTRRTEPDDTLRCAAATLQAAGGSAEELAQRINSWVHQHLSYQHDVTDIKTSAAEALALGRGVCQDYAHIMLTLCRLCRLPARYVSGHLLGEGGTHAWVEVLFPTADGEVRIIALDPTHDREAGPSYVTVAVGRDYGDVAPTSGTYRASYSGELSIRKRVGVTAVDYQ